jgi:hypothetical protein
MISALYAERNVLVRQRFQGRLGHQVFAGAQNPAREPNQQESQGSFFHFTVGERDCDHARYLLPK